jgi:putative ABC transport system permease protein
VTRKVPPGAEDDFELFSNDSLIAQFNSFTVAVRIGVMVISSIALLAAGIGIMNIMLVSVTERTREIGLRMAVGARGRDILTQFLVEAVTLALIGGLIGIVIGAAASIAVGQLAGWRTEVSLASVVLAVGFSGAIGVFFGFYPARTASRLAPIDALRHE